MHYIFIGNVLGLKSFIAERIKCKISLQYANDCRRKEKYDKPQSSDKFAINICMNMIHVNL